MLPPKALAHPWAWTLRQRLRPPALPRSAHLLAAAVIEPSEPPTHSLRYRSDRADEHGSWVDDVGHCIHVS